MAEGLPGNHKTGRFYLISLAGLFMVGVREIAAPEFK